MGFFWIGIAVLCFVAFAFFKWGHNDVSDGMVFISLLLILPWIFMGAISASKETLVPEPENIFKSRPLTSVVQAGKNVEYVESGRSYSTPGTVYYGNKPEAVVFCDDGMGKFFWGKNSVCKTFYFGPGIDKP